MAAIHGPGGPLVACVWSGRTTFGADNLRRDSTHGYTVGSSQKGNVLQLYYKNYNILHFNKYSAKGVTLRYILYSDLRPRSR